MLTFDLSKTNVWVSSDFHYDHVNLCKGTTQWSLDRQESVRDFNTLEDMNQAIVKGINDNVKENDVLIFLGDWCFNGIKNIWNFRKQINCKTIHLVLGNHDEKIRDNKILPNVFSSIEGKETIVFKDEPKHKYADWRDELFEVHAQELFTSVNRVLDFQVKFSKNSKVKRFFASHYAHRIWDERHHGVMHLFAHSHGSLDDSTFDRSMDVGIDSAFKLYGEYRPFNMREIYDILRVRLSEPLDHHNSKTN